MRYMLDTNICIYAIKHKLQNEIIAGSVHLFISV